MCCRPYSHAPQDTLTISRRYLCPAVLSIALLRIPPKRHHKGRRRSDGKTTSLTSGAVDACNDGHTRDVASLGSVIGDIPLAEGGPGGVAGKLGLDVIIKE